MVRAQRTYESHTRMKQARRKSSIRKCSSKSAKSDTNPQLALLFTPSPHYERHIRLPYEIVMKVFLNVVHSSDHPIRDLCNMANVCEAWRMVILQSPSLWSRLNFNELPITDGNLRVLRRLFDELPAILNHVHEVSLSGQMHFKNTESSEFLERIISAPNLSDIYLDRLDSQCKAGITGLLVRAIGKCRQLKRLNIKNTRHFFGNQKWLSDFLAYNGKHLEELHLTSSLRTVSPQLFRSLATDFCPSLRVLDLSTCDYLCNHSFDATVLAQTMPNLVVLRLANVSFKRIYDPPEELGLTRLEELSLPISMRDADRDDALFATLAYGSDRICSLDLRGSCISAHALLSMHSFNIRELHIDDICPLMRSMYSDFIAKWQHSLEVLSLVKINCSRTIKQCLNALVNEKDICNIKDIDLESSDIIEEDLKWFLSAARSLRMINLSSCRSLPRGCKGRYSSSFGSDNSQPLSDLKRRLYADSETEIDEDNSWANYHHNHLPPKRQRVAKKRPDFVYELSD